MKIRYLISVILVYLLFSFSTLFSQNTNLDFEHVYINKIVSSVSIRTIYQDQTGFMWFGATDGLFLFLYNGYKFIPYYISDDNNAILDDTIIKILESKDGNLWIGTVAGLNKYNPKKGDFTRFLNNPKDSNSIYNNIITGMVEDKYGNLWVLTDLSISLYNQKTQKFKNYIINKKESSIQNLKPTAIAVDLDGNILVGYENLILDYIYITEDPGNMVDFDIKYKRLFLHESKDKKDYISRIYQSSDKKYWIGTYGIGFFSIDYKELQSALQNNTHEIKLNHYNSHFNSNNPFPKIVTDICEDKDKNIYITSFGDGLYRYNLSDNSFRTFKYDPKVKTSLSTNYLYSIYIDRSDNIWIGTYLDGINKYSPNKPNFEFHQVKDNNTVLHNNKIGAIYEDREGILWVGKKGLEKIDRKTGESQTFLYDPKNKLDFFSHRIRSIIEDNQHRLWIGSQDGLFCFDKRSNKFIDNYTPELQEFFEGNYIRSLALQNNILWIASYRGLVKYNLLTNKFIVYRNNKNDSTTINDNQVWSLYLDKFDNLWVGTKKGLNLFDKKTESFTQFLTNENQNKLVTDDMDVIVSMESDADNILWVLTYTNGLFCLNPSMKNNEKPDYSKSKLKPITLPLSHKFTTGGLVIDSKQNIWISSDDGIICLDKTREIIRIFDISEFMGYNQFTTGSYFRSRSDEIFFGGPNGMLSFFPEKLKYNDHIPHVVITSITINDFLYYSGTVAANINEIVLKHADDENRLTISFATLEFTNPENNHYKYMLDGYDKDWIDSKDINTATYMDLNPGTYTFKVMGSNNNKVWSETSADLKIIVKPSFLESGLFKIIFVIALILLIYFVIEINLRRIKKQKEKLEIEVQHRTIQLKDANEMLEKEIAEHKKVNELLEKSNKVKDRLFSIISHDLRGSIGSFKDIVKLFIKISDNMNEMQLELIESMNESVTSIYSLLETLLFWATNQKEKIEINVMKHDITPLIKSVSNNLQHMAKPKNINLNSDDIKEGCFAKFDKNSIEIVIRNLTTNALKFTNPNGNVWYTAEKDNSRLIISVNDDGVGISKENIDKIFNNKKRLTTLGTSGEKGTGIGLMLCEDFVRQNGGELWIESEPGKGSSFKFSLPADI